jgi:ribosomal protein L2
VAYLFNSNFQLDVAVQQNLKTTPSLFTAGIGVSYRIDRHNIWNEEPQNNALEKQKKEAQRNDRKADKKVRKADKRTGRGLKKLDRKQKKIERKIKRVK